jgi:hypothetical protein
MSKTLTQEQVLYEATWTAATRKAHKANGGYFAGPDDSFPLKDASDVADAWGLAGHADNPDQVRANIKRWAKQHGHYDALPDTAKDGDSEKQESAATIASTTTRRPLEKIATLKVRWLEYNARSLNGRIYPKATCDRIYESAVKKLAADDLPITCFVSHEAANGNVNTHLVGRASRIWQEGSQFFANLDFADTRTAWDMLGLAVNKSMRAESMRVQGVELMHDRHYDLPLVVVSEGVEPELLGIDLTTRPGLMDTARIQQVLYESQQGAPPYSESFALDAVLVEKEKTPMDEIPLYLQVLAEGITPDRQAHQKVHDHLAGVLDECLKPMHGSESARLRAAIESELSEAGRALAMKHAKRIAAAHDASAQTCGMDCAGCYNESFGIPLDPDQDGDTDMMLVIPDDDSDNGGESARQKGKKTMMTEEEMLAALKAKGYSVEAPKTVQEELEELRTKVAALEESRQSEPQRQTQAPSAMNETQGYQPEAIYEEGEYLAGPIAPAHWKSLSNRRVPWPKDVDPNVALHEMAPFMAYRLLETEANMMGRNVDSFIAAHERV